MHASFKIIGIGEVLWDFPPDGKKTVGGAPANFAYVANALGDRGFVLSRVGDDAAGREILAKLQAKNLSTENVQLDAEHPTGSVGVNFKDGQPVYEIAADAAWDYLELTDRWREIALRADAVCFGSLAQRSAVSRRTIREIVNLVKNLRIFDVNLRGQFFSRETLRKSLNTANVVKFNAEELAAVADIFEIKKLKPEKAARELLVKFGLQMVCVTRGADGSLLVTKKTSSEHAGLKSAVADPIGAGDAFSAALAHGLLRGWTLGEINEFANRVGAFVASQTGAMPAFTEEFRL